MAGRRVAPVGEGAHRNAASDGRAHTLAALALPVDLRARSRLPLTRSAASHNTSEPGGPPRRTDGCRAHVAFAVETSSRSNRMACLACLR